MYCQKCGKEINDMAVICPNCGCSTQNEISEQHPMQGVTNTDTVVNGEKSTLATGALVFSFLMPIVGLILGIVGAVKYKTTKYKKQSIIAIPLSIVVWFVVMIIYSL